LSRKNGAKMRKKSVGKMRKTKACNECQKFRWKKFGKKCGNNWRGKKWINDLER
jgi:recombinational DNA repair protein RecR